MDAIYSVNWRVLRDVQFTAATAACRPSVVLVGSEGTFWLMHDKFTVNTVLLNG